METHVDIIGTDELHVLVDLYSQIFSPPRDAAFFERRLKGRHAPLILIASAKDNAGDERPVGFFVGFELKPDHFFEWLYGVVPDRRRNGIGSQLVDAVHAWAAEKGYEHTRVECHNQHRPMLHTAIARGYDILGIRYDPARHANLVIFEKDLTEL